MAAPFLIVRARGRLCALAVAQVVETMRVPALAMERLRADGSDVPGWLGATTVRGELAAVLDLAVLLGFAVSLAASQFTPGRAVAVRLGGRAVLLAVDEVIGVKTLADGQLERLALPGGQELALGGFDAEFARLLDAGGLLDPQTLAGLEQVLGERAAGEAA